MGKLDFVHAVWEAAPFCFCFDFLLDEKNELNLRCGCRVSCGWIKKTEVLKLNVVLLRFLNT